MENDFPKTIDINPTAKCNLNCEFCWGPNETTGNELLLNQWIEIIDYFVSKGTQSIILTGGEPLLYESIIELINYIKNRGVRIILSTNTLLLDLFKDIDVDNGVDDPGYIKSTIGKDLETVTCDLIV